MIAPLPDNEAARLTTLRSLDILDTAPEVSFDELVALAAYLCQSPISVISLVDEGRQWFKSKVGWQVCTTPRETSFCAHTILQSDLFVVPDAAADKRFADNPLVTATPGIRFYAGAPLVTPEGHALGALCVMDHRPRELTAEQRQALRTLSHIVVRQLRFRCHLLERQLTEQALREGEHRWRSLLEALPQLVWTATPDGTCDYFSTQWTQHTGVPEADLLGWRWLETLHPDDRESTRQAWTTAVQGPSAYDVEYRVRRSDGVYLWFKTRGVPIRDSEGNIFKWFGTCTDITEGKQLEEALRRANARLDLAVRGSNLSIWENDMPDGVLENGHLHYVNVWEQLGYDRPASPTDFATTMALLHPDDRKEWERGILAYLSGETREYEAEFRIRHRDGSYRWLLSRGIAVRDANGKPILFAGSRTDITDRKQTEKELRQAKEAAEAANRAKDEFLANVSHEIRTPMNAILGMTELALDTPLTEDQRQCLKTVKSAADSLLGIINDLLDFSKIEAGKLELDLADFSLRAAVSDTLRALAMRAHKKGLELVSHVQADVPDALLGDAGRLRQVLLNLVGNALKFTEHGEVVVQVRSEMGPMSPIGHIGPISDRPEVRLHFEVRDTGIGIPLDKQEKIFRAFEQEDTSTTRKYGGTGLGLTIAAQLVALMGGTIRVDSEPDRGSIFTFTAQFGRSMNQSARVADSPPLRLRDLRVLIVDDNATNRHILKEWLHSWRMKPAAAGDGLAALDALWHSVALGRPYDLVLLDARIPDTDGLTLAARIRERAELSATRIILLTSGDRPGDEARFRELRVNAHLLKPVQQDELLETIYRVMSRSEDDKMTRRQSDKVAKDKEDSVSLSPNHVALSTFKSLHILVAEDNEFNAQLLEQLLVRRGHRVRLVNNGREALTVVEEANFDLLLLDIHMPELDGFQVIQAIRERERATGGHLQVIALTARSRKEDRERCLAAGMDDYLAKPIQAADLWAAIDRIVTAHSPAKRPSRSLLDARVLLAACGGDGAILKRICAAFQARLPEQLAAVQQAFRNQDTLQLREAAHKLAGMVAAFSTAAGTVASELEDYAATGQLEEARPLVEQLTAMTQELMALVGGLSLETLRSEELKSVSRDPQGSVE